MADPIAIHKRWIATLRQRIGSFVPLEAPSGEQFVRTRLVPRVGRCAAGGDVWGRAQPAPDPGRAAAVMRPLFAVLGMPAWQEPCREAGFRRQVLGVIASRQ